MRGKALAKAYFDGLKEAYHREGGRELWEHFAGVVRGVDQTDLDRLLKIYPDAPESLTELLKLVDGTYWREYQGETVGVYLLGSDVEEYPYYILSARQIAEGKEEFQKWGGYLIRREFEDIPVDEAVCDDMDRLCLLHFADCMNNGGTSKLFLDFSPSDKGKKGQVLRYLHDPDGLAVIADSFDEYLEGLMEEEYSFLNEETLEED